MLEVNALADAGATRLYLKPSVIKKLGLRKIDTVRSFTTNGEALRFKYSPVQLELMGRKENFDVIEVPESVPNLLGQVPLEVLDLDLRDAGVTSADADVVVQDVDAAVAVEASLDEATAVSVGSDVHLDGDRFAVAVDASTSANDGGSS